MVKKNFFVWGKGNGKEFLKVLLFMFKYQVYGSYNKCLWF